VRRGGIRSSHTTQNVGRVVGMAPASQGASSTALRAPDAVCPSLLGEGSATTDAEPVAFFLHDLAPHALPPSREAPPTFRRGASSGYFVSPAGPCARPEPPSRDSFESSASCCATAPRGAVRSTRGTAPLARAAGTRASPRSRPRSRGHPLGAEQGLGRADDRQRDGVPKSQRAAVGQRRLPGLWPVSLCPEMGTEIQIGPTGKTLLPLSVL